MKKLVLIIFVLFISSAASLTAQWLPDVRISTDSNRSFPCFNNARGVAAKGDTVIVVWFDDRDGNREIYFKRSTTGGLTWETETRLTNDPAVSEIPCVAILGSNVHIIWKDSRDGNQEIYYKSSTDAGITWGADIRLTNTPGPSANFSLAVSGKEVYVAWEDVSGGNYDVYFKRSTTQGMSWETDVRITTDGSYQLSPSISASDTLVHIIWSDSRSGNKIYYIGSTDRGETWGSETMLSEPSGNSSEASVSSSGLSVHATWRDQRDGNLEAYYKRSTDAGMTWGPDVRLTNGATQTWHPAIYASGMNIHVVYMEIVGLLEIRYIHSTDGGLTWGTYSQLTNHTFGGAQRPTITGWGSSVHAIWLDTRDNNEEIYYRANPTGFTFINTISSQIPENFHLSQNYPNPFNPMTKIKFDIPKAFNTKLAVYDILGKEVAVLVNDNLKPGSYEVDFSAADLPSGTYFYRLVTDGFSETKKMTLIK